MYDVYSVMESQTWQQNLTLFKAGIVAPDQSRLTQTFSQDFAILKV